MEFFTELFSSESLWILLYLLIAGLIGFLTGYYFWQGQKADLMQQADLSEREAAELRIRNTELIMTQEEVNKEMAATKTDVKNMEAANKVLSREKGQLYAEATLAKKELEDYKLLHPANTVDSIVEDHSVNFDAPQPSTEISLENVMKASASLSSLSAPIIEDAQSALDQKKTSGDNQKEAAEFIKSALGSRIKTASSSQKDNLQMIKGVGPFIEGKLNRLGIYSFEQISQLDEELIGKLTDAIQFFPGRILRDDWVGQAKGLMK